MKPLNPYQTLIQNLPEAIFTCDTQGFIKNYNKAAVNLWGRELVTGKDKWHGSWKIYKEDGADLPLDKYPTAISLKEGKPYNGTEIIIQRQDGSFQHVTPHVFPLFNAQSELTGVVNMLIEVSAIAGKEKRQAEKYRNLIENAADGIFLIDLRGNFLSANKSGCKMLGYDKESLLQLNVQNLVPPQYAGKLLLNLYILQIGYSVLIERQFKRKDGTFFYAELNVQTISGGNIQVIARDITYRKNAEEKLRLSITHYDLLANATRDTVWDWDIINNNVSYNEGIVEMFGFKHCAVELNKEWRESKIHPDDKQMVSDTTANSFKNGFKNFQLEYRFRCGDDTYKYISERSFILFDENEIPVRMTGVMQDITERKRAEEECRNIKYELAGQKVQEQKKNSESYIKSTGKGTKAHWRRVA